MSMKFKGFGLIAGGVAAAVAMSVAAPAAADVTTFASFGPVNSSHNVRWVQDSANPSSGVLYTTTAPTDTTMGAVAVNFSFLQSAFGGAFSNVAANFTMNATTTNDPASLSGPPTPRLTQVIDQGSFSFTLNQSVTFNGVTYGPGANLLSGTFGDSELTGRSGGTSAGWEASTSGGSTILYTSDFLTFLPGSAFDFSFALTSINPVLNRPSASSALRTFRATMSGNFSSDPAPIVGIPEPTTWAMMIGGFGLLGVALRRRRTFAEA